jgi:CRP-like cAMP-binding protein
VLHPCAARGCCCRPAQGATDAHEFFVLEIGSCDVFVTRPGDLAPKKVKTYGPGSAFGELALLYAAPRAATVTTTSPCKVSLVT